MTETPQEIAIRLCVGLAARRIKPSTLCAAAGVGSSTWHRILNGVGGANHETLNKLQKAYDALANQN